MYADSSLLSFILLRQSQGPVETHMPNYLRYPTPLFGSDGDGSISPQIPLAPVLTARSILTDWHVDDLDKRWKMKDVEYTVHIQYNLCCQSPFRSLHAGRIPNLNDMVACSIPRMVLARRKQKLILLADACHLRLSYPCKH